MRKIKRHGTCKAHPNCNKVCEMVYVDDLLKLIEFVKKNIPEHVHLAELKVLIKGMGTQICTSCGYLCVICEIYKAVGWVDRNPVCERCWRKHKNKHRILKNRAYVKRRAERRRLGERYGD